MDELFTAFHVFPNHGLISHLGLVGVVFFVVAVVSFIGRTVYNLYLHPLRSYPGPWFARASRLPFSYYLVTGRLPQEVMKWHEKYGDTIRIAPNDLSFIQGQAWFDVHGHRSAARTGWFERDPNLHPTLPGRAHSLVNSNDQDHSRFRRLLSHAFSEKALREQESLIQSHIDLLIARLHTEINSPNKGVVDMVKWLTFITFDVISDLAFGKSFNCVKEGPHPWVELILDFMREIAYLAALGYLPTPIFKMIISTLQYFMLEEIQKANEYVDRSVASRLEQGTSRKDFVSPILEANAEKGMTVDEMASNFEVLMVAGSGTTNTLLSGALYHLLTHDSILQSLLAELHSAFPSRTGVSMAAVGSLPYLNAVLEESLRVYPPSAHGHQRIVPHGGATICGKVVPEGTSVGVPTLAASLSERNWTEPLAFKPERWLGEAWAGDDHKSFQPFLVGPRNCLGKNLAYAEMRLILARLLLEFDFELCEESREWYKDQKFHFLWAMPPLKLRLRERAF